MPFSIARGVIDRKVIVQYRVDPDVLALQLPEPYRPRLIRGVGVAGVCVFRVRGFHHRLLPTILQNVSENIVYRVGVEWTEDQKLCAGVYTLRQETSSLLKSTLERRTSWGTRLFHAHIRVDDHEGTYRIAACSRDAQFRLLIQAQLQREFTAHSVFRSAEDAAEFLERQFEASVNPDDSRPTVLGTRHATGLDEYNVGWHVEPLAIQQLVTEFFDDTARFPAGAIQFDCAVVASSVQPAWSSEPGLCIEGAP